MTELALWILSLVVVGMCLYWIFRFHWFLPLETSWDHAREFTKELSEYARVPYTREILLEIIQKALMGLHRLFPRCAFWVFERELETGWKIFSQVGMPYQSRLTPLVTFQGGSLESLGKEGASMVLEEQNSSDPLLKLLKETGIRSLCLIPWGVEEGLRGVLGVGSFSRKVDPRRAGFFLEILKTYLTPVFFAAHGLWDLRREEEHLKGEISVAMQELSESNQQLIRRSRERRALYEVASAIETQPQNPEASLVATVNIVARAVEADVCAFLLLNEEDQELVTQPGAYGVEQDEISLYRIPLSNADSTSVRVFLSGEPFMTEDAQSDPRVLRRYAELWKIHSLIVVPLTLEGRRLGVLRVASHHAHFFTQDHLDLVVHVVKEAAVIVEGVLLSRRLSQTADELSQLNRLKDEFVSTVSHELKTPLTAIRGFLSVILQGEAGPLTHQQERFLTIAQSASERLYHLISDLLDVSRLDNRVEMEIVPTALESLLRSSVESAGVQAKEKGVNLELEVPEDIPLVSADPKWIRQVVDNLISNGIKFTPGSGAVRVQAVSKGDAVLVCVRDTGVGISAEDKPRIFEKFYRGKGPRNAIFPGSGLGLAICKSIVEKHGGHIWVESELDQGSQFFFTLPAAPQESASVNGGQAQDKNMVSG
ncbi:MAG: GAF domain-containing sensor histidine kinase [Elusimicrobia bacterium]|nr:GAF domain-containing sensor histidine kinase [Elusimicrobiota bacterium]